MRSSMMGAVGVACAAWACGASLAADLEPGKSGVPKKTPETAVAERGPFEAVLELKGGFEPVEAAVVAGRPAAFTQSLEIVKVVAHGARVAEGEVILELAADKIDRAIADLEIDLAAGEKALDLARRELAAAEALAPLELADAERQDRIATEDRARFTAVGREIAEEAARFSLKAGEFNLRSGKEELSQLEKMYKDKDLTEETEEMILERQRFAVASAERSLRAAKVQSEDVLTLGLPRQAVELDRAARKAALALEKARATLPLQLEQKRLGVAKQEHERKQSLRKLEELRHDRGLAVVKAPRAGVVYYGRLHQGAWTTDAVAAKAIAGQSVSLGELAFTVVGVGPVRFRAKVEEKDLHLVVPGLAGRLTPTGYPDAEVAVALEPGFAPVPRNATYDALFLVTAPAGGATIVPGMTGTARFVARSRPDAITVPEGAVSREADGTRVVYMDRGESPAERRAVKAGLTSGGRIEILEGLAAGDRVRTAKP